MTPFNKMLLTVQEAAKLIGVTRGRVVQMLQDGLLSGQQYPPEPYGRWLISYDTAKAVADTKPATGRPRSRS